MASRKLKFKEAMRLVFTVLIVALRRSERIATSLESRGFGLKARSVYRPTRLRASDVVIWYPGLCLSHRVLLAMDVAKNVSILGDNNCH